jgi:hypothetical protein
MGVAHAVAPDLYLYEDGTTKLRFTIKGRNEIYLESVGDGYKSHCGLHGVVEAGTYTRKANAS